MVISIIVLLIALLLPALRQAREAARRMLCMTQVKQMATATHMYANDFNDWTPPIANVMAPYNTGWTIPGGFGTLDAKGPSALIPYLGGGESDMRLRQDGFQFPLPNHSVWEIFLCPTWAMDIEPVLVSEHYYYWEYGGWTDHWVTFSFYNQFCGYDNFGSGFPGAIGAQTKLSALTPRFPLFADIAWLNDLNWNNVTYIHNYRLNNFEGMNVCRADGSADWTGASGDIRELYGYYEAAQGRSHMYPKNY